MDSVCSEFERLGQRLHTWLTDEERRDWERHLACCPFCRDQLAAEEALEDLFSETAFPELSNHFNENLRQRIAEEQVARKRWPILVMQAYWLTASLISLVILLNMESIDVPVGLAVMIFFLFCFFGPTLLLSRKLRFGLFDLILSTMTPQENPAEFYHNGISQAGECHLDLPRPK